MDNQKVNFKTEKELQDAILREKARGTSDLEIGQKYGVTFKYIERLITRTQGVNISALKVSKRIKMLVPKNFKEERTTVWSFKQRGNWATHSGEYRGNWSPYIPRNVILKYSKPGELVLDYFCGAGTTAVEAKLLGRRCIAFDINDKAIELAKKNVTFDLKSQQLTFIDNERQLKIYEPELFVGDARDLSFLKDDSIDLICAHPPYADIIHYTNYKNGDLSFLTVEDYLKEMEKVAKESYRVLKPGRQCAILIGDMRKHKHVIPLGFKFINVYLNAGFKLKELVIKRQHNCKTTGFWYENSIKYNFLLLAHEYLPIFEKPEKEIMIKEQSSPYGIIHSLPANLFLIKKIKELETTTVWIFPEDQFENLLDKNVVERYREGKPYRIINLVTNSEIIIKDSSDSVKKTALLFIKSPCLDNNISKHDINMYLEQLKKTLFNECQYIKEEGHCVIQTKDIRVGEYIEPLAKYIVDFIDFPSLSLKEIVIVTTESHKDKFTECSKNLHIAHQYLLVYKVIKSNRKEIFKMKALK
jgi:DNA modification methylase